MLAFLFRSYAQARYAFVETAGRMMFDAPGLTGRGGSHQYVALRFDGHPFDLASCAVQFESLLSIRQLLGLARAIERQLGGGLQGRDEANGTEPIVIDLLWVFGAKLSAPEITLPNPIIGKAAWAARPLADASQDFIPSDSLNQAEIGLALGLALRKGNKKVVHDAQSSLMRRGESPNIAWHTDGMGLADPLGHRREHAATRRLGHLVPRRHAEARSRVAHRVALDQRRLGPLIQIRRLDQVG
jgi:hypothetical protein